MKCEWQKITIGNLGTIVTGKTPTTKRPEYWGEKVPFITPKDLQGTKHIFHTERFITDKGMESVKGSVLPPNSVCVSCIGNIGYVGMVTKKCISNQQINSIVPNENYSSDFVYYLMRSLWPFFKNYEGQSTTLSILNKTQFSKIEIWVPELETQKKIAAVLSTLDDKIELNNKISENLQQHATALFDKLCNDTNDRCPFTEIIQILGGGTPKTKESSYWNGNIPFFTPKDVGSPYTLTTEKTITEEGLAHCNSHLYPQNTVFVTARGTVGKVGMAGVPMAMNQSCYALVGKETHQLLVYFYTLKVVNRLKHKASGAVFDAITTRDFESEEITKLSDSAAETFLNVAKPIYEAILSNCVENLRLAALREELLPRLMSGEVDVSNLQV